MNRSGFLAAAALAAAALAPAAGAREFWISLDGTDDAEYTEEDPGTYAGLGRQFQRHAPLRKASFRKGYDTLVLKDGVYCLQSPPPGAKGGYSSPWEFNWDGRCLLIRSASGDPKKCYFQAPKGESYHCPLQFNTSPHVKEPQFKLKDIGFRGFSGPASYPFQSGPPCVELENCELQDADGTPYGVMNGRVMGRPDCGYVVSLDLKRDFIRDQREATAGVGLGYAGCVTYRGGGNEGPFDIVKDLYLNQPDLLAERMREAGAWVLREWYALDQWQQAYLWARETKAGRKWPGDLPELDPAILYSFRQRHGMKIVLDVEPMHAVYDPDTLVKTHDVKVVCRVVKDYLRWIADNGFKDQVIGFELGNEPYFGNEPEKFGERSAAIVRAMREVWPDVRIAMPLAEYTAGDPDLKAVRARLGNREWMKGEAEFFSENRWHQWSGRYIEEMKRQGALDLVTHVVYHFYGGNRMYGCSGRGLQRITNFAKVYPEIADKKVWITEWRERSDEDDWCHQTFRSTLFKAHYAITCLGDPRVESTHCHNIFSLAGGLNFSDGRTWYVQWDGRKANRPDVSGDGRVKVEVGPMGPFMRLYTEALKDHPILLKIGNARTQGPGSCTDIAAYYYEGHSRHWQWLAATNPERTSLAMLMVGHGPWKFRIDLPGYELGDLHYRVLSMVEPGVEEHVWQHHVTGEEPLWETKEWDVKVDARTSRYIATPYESVLTITMPMKEVAK